MTAPTTTASGTATATSVDPNKGIVYLVVGVPGKNGTTDMVQATGVLIAPDEVLTAAHVGYGTSGLRSTGTAIVGYNKGTYTAVDTVDAVHVPSQADYTTNAGDAKDYAVIHLKTPVTNGTIFQLGQGGGAGTYNVSGYPAGTGGAVDTQSEALTMDGSNSLFKGVPLNQGTNNPHGSSGGPVWQTINGKPTVLGDISSMSGDGKTGYFKQLTAADVSQIQAWEKQDHSVGSTVVNGTSTPATVSAAATAATATKKTDAPVFGADVFGDALASMVSDDASSAAGPRATVMSDVSAAITKAATDGGSFSDMVSDATAYLNDNSSMASRAVSYLGGLLSSVTGGTAATLFSDVNAMSPGTVSDGGTRAAAAAGFREGSNAVSTEMSGLASAIAGVSGGTAATSDAAASAVAASTLVAPAIDHHKLAA